MSDFTISNKLTTAKQEQRAKLAKDVALWEARGGSIEQLPIPEYRLYLETPIKPHPEAVQRCSTIMDDEPKKAPKGMMNMKEAMELCNFDSTSSSQIRTFTEMSDCGTGPHVASRKETLGGKSFRYYRKSDIDSWNKSPAGIEWARKNSRMMEA